MSDIESEQKWTVADELLKAKRRQSEIREEKDRVITDLQKRLHTAESALVAAREALNACKRKVQIFSDPTPQLVQEALAAIAAVMPREGGGK